MENLLKGTKLISEDLRKWGLDIISVRFDNEREGIHTRVHVYKTSFIEVAESLNIVPCTVQESNTLEDKIELYFDHDGIEFFTLVDEKDMKQEFRNWIYEERNISKAEILPRGVTNEQWAMKQSGMALKDFM